MRRLIDLTGKKFGKLTVVKRASDYIKPSGAKMVQWECRCDCGKIITARGDNLRANKTTSCGCSRIQSNYNSSIELSKRQDKENIGKSFGDLTVIKRIDNKGTNVMYLCKCSCGKEIKISRSDLNTGKRTHCGCKKIKASHYKDITGQRFGKLVALYPTKQNNRRAMMWMFQCDCGNKKEIEGNSVTRGNTLSCGCLKQSHGELIIEALLNKNKIPFVKEKYLFNYPTGDKALFDFYVNNKYLIEFDGEQHFKSSNRWWNTEEFVNVQKERDKIKNQQCKENNIPLIRIPYTYLKDLCFEDLMLETSKFVVS